MTLIVVKLNDQKCRAIIATNFSNSFCGSKLIKNMGITAKQLINSPKVNTSDGTQIEFIGEVEEHEDLMHSVSIEIGPWKSDGMIPLLVAWDCPADMLIGNDLITEIGKTFPIKFEFYKNAVNIGETRVSMLDPLSSEEKFISVVVNDPRTNKEVGKETWRKGNKETFVPGGLVTRRVEVVGKEDSKGLDIYFKIV
ncbi:unnamed protein product [Meloidogyne enterolobii]|uniref:Uncharacterized protein n=1 Tax=Meloidogyne enterolobii TaxID=390850 RepID=A0ACB0YMI2_MELEN